MATSQKKEDVLDAGVQIPIVILDDAIIDVYPSTDYLEVRLNDVLRWTDHVQRLVSKLSLKTTNYF